MFGAGVFTIVAAVMDWNWFMNNYRARFFVKLFGRFGARIFYVLLGFFLVGLSIMFYLGGS
ncbi:MAG: immunity 17 family protein [Chloroflexi bacterium]|nr:immunity 17 family protein [Chloroflexota bacterium]